MMRLPLILAAVGLVACSPAPPEPASAPVGGIVDGPHSAPAPKGPDTPVSSPADRPAAYVPPPPENPDDPCEAKRFGYLVGKPKGDVPVPPPNRTWRVYSTTDAVTEDYNPQRMNVMWDADTGIVKSVTCG